MADNLSSLSKVVPTLTGTDNFVKWRRAITNYLLDKGALRVLEGRETEPHRAGLDPAHPPDIIRPPGQRAGDEPPDAQSSSTGSALTAAQRAAWDKWAEKEAKARSTLILTVSDGIAAEVENLWSSAEIYTHITAEHKVDTYQRRGDLMARIHMLSLPEAASRETMIDHYERFITLISESIAAGTRIEDWEKCEKFLLSLSHDLDPLKFQFELLPSDRRSWRELVQIYKSLADRHGLEADRQATVNAILSRDSNYGKGKPGTRDNAKGGKGNKSKGKGSKNDAKRCMHCNNKGHTIDECRKKANGEPSRKEILELAKKVAKDGKPDSGRPNASINATRAVIETPQVLLRIDQRRQRRQQRDYALPARYRSKSSPHR